MPLQIFGKASPFFDRPLPGKARPPDRLSPFSKGRIFDITTQSLEGEGMSYDYGPISNIAEGKVMERKFTILLFLFVSLMFYLFGEVVDAGPSLSSFKQEAKNTIQILSACLINS